MAIRKSADRYMAILEGGVRKGKNWVGLPVHNRKTQVGTDELHLLLRFEFFVSMTSFIALKIKIRKLVEFCISCSFAHNHSYN